MVCNIWQHLGSMLGKTLTPALQHILMIICNWSTRCDKFKAAKEAQVMIVQQFKDALTMPWCQFKHWSYVCNIDANLTQSNSFFFFLFEGQH